MNPWKDKENWGGRSQRTFPREFWTFESPLVKKTSKIELRLSYRSLQMEKTRSVWLLLTLGSSWQNSWHTSTARGPKSGETISDRTNFESALIPQPLSVNPPQSLADPEAPPARKIKGKNNIFVCKSLKISFCFFSLRLIVDKTVFTASQQPSFMCYLRGKGRFAASLLSIATV